MNRQQQIQQYVQLGFPPALVHQAMERVTNIYDQNQMLDTLSTLQGQAEAVVPRSEPDEALQQALMASRQDNPEQQDFATPVEKLRSAGLPVGLKNVGNTCYFNSLAQTYFMNHDLVKALFEFRKVKVQGEEGGVLRRKEASLELVAQLQRLFVHMAGSAQKYISPVQVLTSMVDDHGALIKLGDQKDVTEFNMQLLARIDEGLHLYQQSVAGQVRTSVDRMETIQDECLIMKDSDRMLQSGHTLTKELVQNVKSQEIDTLVGRLFFGKSKTVLRYNQRGQAVETTEDDIFGMLPLNVEGDTDLYSAWEAHNFQRVEGYQLNDQKVDIEKETWVERAPQTLFFQLQRLQYDRKQQSQVKLHVPFAFDKTMFLDRFLYKNRKAMMTARERVASLKESLCQLQAQLSAMDDYQHSGMDLLTILSLAHHNLQHTPQAISLQIHIDAMKVKRTQLESEIRRVQREVDKEFDHLKKEKYVLQSIMVHSGDATGGHYYSFNYDFTTHQWFRYNDSEVTAEQEDVVFKESKGGYQKQSAYCLIYVKESSLRPVSESLPLLTYQVQPGGAPVDLYRQYIKHNGLDQELDADNQRFQYEVEQYTATEHAKTVLDIFEQHYENNNEVSRKLKEQSKTHWGSKYMPPLNTFYTYLRNCHHNQDGSLDELAKAVILHRTFDAYSQDHSGPLKQATRNKMSSLISNFSQFKRPQLSVPHQLYSLNLTEYTIRLKLTHIATESLRLALNNRTMESIQVMDLASKMTSYLRPVPTDFLVIFSKDHSKLSYLILCHQCCQAAAQQDVAQVRQLMNFLDQHTARNNMRDSPFLWQIGVWLNDMLSQHPYLNTYSDLIPLRDSINKQSGQLSQAVVPLYEKIQELEVDLGKYDDPAYMAQFLQVRKESKVDNTLFSLFDSFKMNNKPYLALFDLIIKRQIPQMLQDRRQVGIL